MSQNDEDLAPTKPGPKEGEHGWRRPLTITMAGGIIRMLDRLCKIQGCTRSAWLEQRVLAAERCRVTQQVRGDIEKEVRAIPLGDEK